MTVGEYEGAKKKQDSIVISVKHKTADTHSPACVVLSPTLFSYLQVYFKEVQSKVLDLKCYYDEIVVFVSEFV